jgi:hypothetical protein
MKYARDLFPTIDDLPTRQIHSFPELADEQAFWQFYESSKSFSLLHVPGFYNLYQSIKYIKANRIRGALVECGCFLGGAAIFMGLVSRYLGWRAEIILFDTFEGPPIGSEDVIFGHHKLETPNKLPDYERAVRDNISGVLGSCDGYTFVRGLVEDTLPTFKVPQLALARLDTDFYSSTKIELHTLYPRLANGGVLTIDDYGMFAGSRRATDEYFAAHSRPPLLNRIDGGVWSGVKPHATWFDRIRTRSR